MLKESLVEKIFNTIEFGYLSKRHLERGSTSEVWLVETQQGSFVLRVQHNKKNKQPSLAFDLFIRNTLIDQGCKVAKPVLSSIEVGIPSLSEEWVIDTYINGHVFERGCIPSHICFDLSETLINLHKIKGNGFGTPENREVQTLIFSPKVGLNTRFDYPWPFTDLSLMDHPVSVAPSKILKKMAAVSPEMNRYLEDSESVVVHSDLHEKQIICNKGKLEALIDFGDAMYADPVWDLASFYYFHGEQCLEWLLEAYTNEYEERNRLARKAKLFSVSIACHHAARSKVLGLPHRLEASIKHLHRVFEC